MTITTVTLSALLFFAALTDLLQNKIHNKYAVALLVTGLLMSVMQGGITALPLAFLSVLITFVLMLPVYLIKGIGAGDVKLLTGAAAFLIPAALPAFLGMSFVLAAVGGALRLIVSRGRTRTIRFAVPVFLSGVLMCAM
ncbi:MAG: prepilin peptidase [Lachnospiraceae bacterium]|nr:prepilin peptidase [Lachnospiraceae bacterium]